MYKVKYDNKKKSLQKSSTTFWRKGEREGKEDAKRRYILKISPRANFVERRSWYYQVNVQIHTYTGEPEKVHVDIIIFGHSLLL